MDLESFPHIEGLEAPLHPEELLDDTPVEGVRVRFEVVAEDTPLAKDKDGNPQPRTNFVYIIKEKNLGRDTFRRRINDVVEFNVKTGKWVVKALVPGKISSYFISDIRRYPNEWNSFMRGVSADEVGTPLSTIFSHDPSRVQHYADHHITTVERLAGTNFTDAQALGMGAHGDIEYAKKKLEVLKAGASATAAMTALAERDRVITSQGAQIAELTAKLNELLSRDIEELRKPEKPKKPSLRSRPREDESSEVAE